jgi:hypothetical protein
MLEISGTASCHGTSIGKEKVSQNSRIRTYTLRVGDSMPSSRSLIMEFRGISEEDAERLVAVTWRILEAHALISPALDVRRVKALIDISLLFESTVERALVENSPLREPTQSTSRPFSVRRHLPIRIIQ